MGARRTAEIQLQDRIREAVPSADAASAHIDSLPFLGRLAVSGHVSAVRASVSDVTVSSLRVASVHVDLHDVHIDRDRLALHRQLDIKSIARGLATADIAEADLRQALHGLPVVLGDGTIRITVAGRTTTVSANVRDNVLRLTANGVSVPSFTIPKVPLLPCVTQAVAMKGRLHLSCSVDQVPAELLRKVNAEIRG